MSGSWIESGAMSSVLDVTSLSAEAPPSVAHSEAGPRWWFWFGAVLAAAAVLFFARLGSRALWSSEFRWAEIAREMQLTSNYFWPTINGRVYYDKPLGTYWVILASSHLTAGLDETAARLPCAIAGVLGVALLMLLTRRLYDNRTALLAGFILATSFSFVFFSRHASADVETITGELAALLLFIRNEDRQDGWWVVALWTIMAVTSQMKGLLGFALPVLIITTYCCLGGGWAEFGRRVMHGRVRERIRWLIERNRWLCNWKSVIAIALGFAVYYGPFAISNRVGGSTKGLQMVWHENILRFFHPFDHRGPIYLYVYVIFALMAPWSMLLPAALAQAHRRRPGGSETHRGDRFTLVFFWATFIFFTVSGSRRSYYLLPILPAAAILVARLLVSPGMRSKLANRLLAIGYALVAISAVAGIGLLLPPSAILEGPLAALPAAPDPAAIVVFWLISVGGIIYALKGYRPERVALSVGLIAYCVMAYIYMFAMPAAEAYRGEKPFAIKVRDLLGGQTSGLAFYKTQAPLFYLNPPKPLPEYDQPQDLLSAVEHDKIRWFIARRRDVPKLEIAETIEMAEASYPWETDADVRNKVVLIRVAPAFRSGP